MAATHRGKCQLCGATYKVNVKTGRLAAHGYTIDHNMFNGECRGSYQLPLEQSCGIIAEFITTANTMVEANCAEILALGSNPKGWLRLRAGLGGLVWREVVVTEEGEFFCYVKQGENRRVDRKGRSLNEFLVSMSERRIEWLWNTNNQLQSLIRDSNKTIAEWVEAPLIAIQGK